MPFSPELDSQVSQLLEVYSLSPLFGVWIGVTTLSVALGADCPVLSAPRGPPELHDQCHDQPDLHDKHMHQTGPSYLCDTFKFYLWKKFRVYPRCPGSFSLTWIEADDLDSAGSVAALVRSPKHAGSVSGI